MPVQQLCTVVVLSSALVSIQSAIYRRRNGIPPSAAFCDEPNGITRIPMSAIRLIQQTPGPGRSRPVVIRTFGRLSATYLPGNFVLSVATSIERRSLEVFTSPLPRRAEECRTGEVRPRCPSEASLAAGRSGAPEGGKPAGPGRRGRVSLVTFLSRRTRK